MLETQYLDEEEKDLMEGLDNLDISTLSKPSAEKQRLFKEAAHEFQKKETKMNIRIDEFELQRIKDFAQNEGLRYQAFVRSVLHKYITGQLVEKSRLS